MQNRKRLIVLKTEGQMVMVTSETTHRLQARSFDLQGDAQWKSIVSGISVSLYRPVSYTHLTLPTIYSV